LLAEIIQVINQSIVAYGSTDCETTDLPSAVLLDRRLLLLKRLRISTFFLDP